jgi:hypothetical protein
LAAVIGAEAVPCTEATQKSVGLQYRAHRESGGAPDLVQEQLIAEVAAEKEFGALNVQSAPATPQ